MKKWSKSHKELIVFLLYAGLTLSLLFFHENWRDEAQAWLLARDCTIPELVNAMKYEGHFLLWYFILMPFAKSGFPYGTINIISWIISCLTVLLILFKAPFAFSKKVLLIFTFPLFYQYPVISRCYCLIPLAIVLMGIFHKDRKEKPFRYFISIVLLLNTHVIMAGLVAVVCIDYLVELYERWRDLSEQEKRKLIVSILIASVLMVASIFPLLECLSTNKTVKTGGELILNLKETFFNYPLVLHNGLFLVFNSIETTYFIILVITIITLIFEAKDYSKNCFAIGISILWQCFIYSFIYGPSFQRIGTIIFIILFFKWKDAYNSLSKISNLTNFQNIIRIFGWKCLVISNIVGGFLFLVLYALPYNYSNAHDMASYINIQLHDDSVILGGSHVEFLSSIIPYIERDIKFYHVPGKRFFSYAIWDNLNTIDIECNDIQELPKTFCYKRKLYYVFCSGKGHYFDVTREKKLIDKMIEKKVFKKLYCTNNVSISSENYTIFEVNLGGI